MNDTFIISGPLVHCLNFGEISIIENGFIAVDKGKIVACGSDESQADFQRSLKISDGNVITLLTGQFLMPGLIDSHIHAPQYPNAGLGYDKPLLEWLDNYTFPLEAQYTDQTLAQTVYSTIVKRTISNGTTTACYFATIHLESSIVLADEVEKAGQRAFVGKVNMNQNHPDNYGETTAQSLLDTEAFVLAVQGKKNPLVEPVITPRFAISCDMTIMEELGKMAAKYDVFIQTHISESRGEIDIVHEMYPDCATYAHVYDKAGLLTSKTVLAHGVHLEDEELKILSDRGTSISHCPNSNTCLRSGICDVRRLLNAGVKVGLGTDISGGYSPSILDAMRCALTASTHTSFSAEEDYNPLTYQDVFYMATIGGAQALALDDKVGNFKVGKDFDALVISLKIPDSPVDLFGDFNTLELVQKFIYLGDNRNITQVFVAGKLVKNNNLSIVGNFRQRDVILLCQ